jgi:hypothetical protein
MTNRIAQFTLVFTLAVGVTSAYAQKGQGDGHGGDRGGGGGGGQMMGEPKDYLENRMAELEKILDLSSAQAVAVQALHQEFFDKLEQARSSGDRRAMMEQMRKLRDDTDAEVIGLLNDEQAARYKEIRKEEMEEMRSRMRERQERG